jgi:hypothetical protein
MIVKPKTIITFMLCLTSSISFPTYAEKLVISTFELDSYRGNLLKHALSYSTEHSYKFDKFDATLPTVRAYNLMAENGGIDVMTGTSTAAREQKHLAVKIPIYKGLNGWRIPIINKDNKDILAKVTSKKMLQNLVAGQVLLWTDTKILKSNNLPVSTGQFYGLFQMLDKERLHYFPQSALQAFQNIKTYHNLNIMLDTHIALQYPTAVYFYVNKENLVLANDIKVGLESALVDGSFDKLFNQYYAEALTQLNLDERHIIILDNPYLVEGTPLHREELWHSIVKSH